MYRNYHQGAEKCQLPARWLRSRHLQLLRIPWLCLRQNIQKSAASGLRNQCASYRFRGCGPVFSSRRNRSTPSCYARLRREPTAAGYPVPAKVKWFPHLGADVVLWLLLSRMSGRRETKGREPPAAGAGADAAAVSESGDEFGNHCPAIHLGCSPTPGYSAGSRDCSQVIEKVFPFIANDLREVTLLGRSRREREAFVIWKRTAAADKRNAGDAERGSLAIRRFIESTCNQPEIPQAFGDAGWSLQGSSFCK